MSTLIGASLSHYRIVEKIGAGGMGEVYRARDTRLGRDVAIKVLPQDFASDPERLERFEREAKVLASLSHPNLAGIHGVEESEGRRYLVLEFVEGETLAARLARGPLPLDDAVDLCIQIAMGMEAAHERGIVHRDLKPGNVMITADDQVKVVDFGLAKGRVKEQEPGLGESPTLPESPTVPDSPALALSPTLGTPATLPGVILGTAAYLSPEQARGKAVDRRTDIWSFGCILYECLTGRRAFEGETVSDLVATILKGDVDWSRLPKDTPVRLRDLLQHCLEKDPRKRLRDMGDARLTLEEVRESKGLREAPKGARRRSPWSVANAALLLLVGAASGIAIWNFLGPARQGMSSREIRRFSLVIPPEIQATGAGLSPDGRSFVVAGTPRAKEGEQPARPRLYRRRTDGSEFQAVEGSEGVIQAVASPDSRWLYFLVPMSGQSVELRLMKAPAAGGTTPVTVVNWEPSWSTSYCVLESGDLLVMMRGQAAFVRVHADGSTVSAPIKLDSPGFSGTFSFTPMGNLPGGRGILLNTVSYEGGGYLLGTGVLDPATGRVKVLLRDGGNAAYSPTGHLLFARVSALLAVPFDLRRLEVRGEPVSIMDGLRTAGAYSNGVFQVLADGTLLYFPGGLMGGRQHLIVADAQGRTRDWGRERGYHDFGPIASPDGSRAACTISSARALDEIWLFDRTRPSARRIVSVPGVDCWTPVWSPDGRQIAYYRRGYDEADGLYLQPLDGGAPKRILSLVSKAGGSLNGFANSWSPDGSALLVTHYAGTRSEIFRVQVHPAGDSLSVPVPLLPGPANAQYPAFSPDGRWVAYQSNESGQDEIYVAPNLPDGSLGAPLMVSVGGGWCPRWGRSGKELFYQGGAQGHVMSVLLKFQPALSAAEPVSRWDFGRLRAVDGKFDILPGDELLAVQKGEEEDEITRVDVVLNFFEELRQKLRAARKG